MSQLRKTQNIRENIIHSECKLYQKGKKASVYFEEKVTCYHLIIYSTEYILSAYRIILISYSGNELYFFLFLFLIQSPWDAQLQVGRDGISVIQCSDMVPSCLPAACL